MDVTDKDDVTDCVGDDMLIDGVRVALDSVAVAVDAVPVSVLEKVGVE